MRKDPDISNLFLKSSSIKDNDNILHFVLSSFFLVKKIVIPPSTKLSKKFRPQCQGRRIKIPCMLSMDHHQQSYLAQSFEVCY